MIVKELVRDVIENQPDDASYEEIIRELAFDRMVERGLDDVRANCVIDSEEMSKQIKQWSIELDRRGKTLVARDSCVHRAR